ncbi:MAG: metallophosphoesterase [Ignavibacteriales bacterium]|nr:metallophosphoesterase [Ignavibacteriales bacterium]
MSDMQSPLWFEKIVSSSDNNEKATQFMLDNIGRDMTVAALFLLGDLTALGSFKSYWDDFYEKTIELRKAYIPLFPALGNHEYEPFESKGKEHFAETFPYIKPEWYSKRIKNIEIIILNSNYSKLDENRQIEQLKWYQETIKKFDADSTVGLIIVGCHHSPYTNSRIVEPSSEVQTYFLPPFLKSTKAKIFISGHSHAFEHFRKENKDFLVIGGGGGLLHKLKTGKQQQWEDLYPVKSDKRFFHYVRCTISSDTLHVNVMKLSPDRKRFDTLNIVNIGLN